MNAQQVPTVPDQPTYGVIGACAYLNCSETSLHELIESGELAASKPSKEFVIRKVVLEAFLAKLEQEQTEARREAFLMGVKPQIKTAVFKVRAKRRVLPDLDKVMKNANTR